jgi:hypothetical protein
MSLLHLPPTSVYPPIAGISALGECVNGLINNVFCKMGFFVPENFLHNVWLNLIVVSNVKIISLLISSFIKY